MFEHYRETWRSLDEETQHLLIGNTYMWTFIILGTLTTWVPLLYVGVAMVLVGAVALWHLQRLGIFDSVQTS